MTLYFLLLHYSKSDRQYMEREYTKKMMTLEDVIQLLKSAKTSGEIDEKREDIASVIQAIREMFGYDQMNAAHQYDLWLHSVNTALNLQRNLDDDMLYLAALLHDIGKPECRCQGSKPEDTNMHYYGHPVKSMEIVRDVVLPELDRQGFYIGAEDMKRLLYYIEYHDDHVSLRLKHLRRHLRIADFEEFQKLMLLQVADAKAHVLIPLVEKRIMICSALAGVEGEELYKRILAGE